MYRSARYLVEDEAAIEAFVARQRHGELIVCTADGFPQVSILPFVKRGDEIALHAVQEDPVFQALQSGVRRATFLVADFLAFSPHDWVDAEDAGRATLNFIAVQYFCEAETCSEPAAVAETLSGLLRAYEPTARYAPIEDGAFYGPRLRRLGVVRLRVLRREAKFKTGPFGPAALRRHVAAKLRERAEPGDARAAAVIEAYAKNQA
ncbi:MAG TPA: FMN-binding negative transcriptional regulator, partial [Dehalococcoidia bacterium]|nr:FMN-binding negative transcriptional regulator [Dehalococcoidia bacterium]